MNVRVNLFKPFTILILICIFFNACKNNSEAAPQETCDTMNMNFNTHIAPILKSNCITCHSKALYDSTGIMNLESYTEVKVYLDNDYHADGIYGSKLMHIIEQTGSVPNMPPSYKLSHCEISKIQAWIHQKAPEN